MLSLAVRTLGWIGFALAIGYFMISDNLSGEHGDRAYVHTTQQILMASCGLVLGGYLLKFASGIAGAGTARCKKCGKRISKSEMFCFDHRRESIWEAQERTRYAGGKIKSKA